MKKFAYILLCGLPAAVAMPMRAAEPVVLAEAADPVEAQHALPAPNPWSYGLFAGVGGVFPTGSIADSFSGGCAFTFGVQGGWRRIHLEGTISYAIPTLRDPELAQTEYAGQGYHANVKNANYLAAGFGAGYAVVDGRRFAVIPYIGGWWTGYNWTARPMSADLTGALIPYGPQQRMKLDDFNIGFGIHLEWHFNSAATELPLLDEGGEHYVSSLRLTPYAIRSAYNQAPVPCSGWQVGITLSYSGLARILTY